MKCPSLETLIASTVSESGESDAALAAHIATCPTCRAAVRLIHESMLCESWSNPKLCIEQVSADDVELSSWGMANFTPDLLLYLNGVEKGGKRVYATWSSSLHCREPRERPQLVATRALGETPHTQSPTTLSFSKREKDCVLQIGVDLTGQGVTLRFELLSADGLPILPFLLSVRDVETKCLLLDKQEFKSGAAVLRGVECGRYAVKAESKAHSCFLSFKVG